MESNRSSLIGTCCGEGSAASGQNAEHCVQGMEGAVMAALANSESFWKTVSEKQLFIERLRAEQIKTSDKFTRFNAISRNVHLSGSENIANFHRFSEISEQVQILEHFLTEFEEKLQKSEKIVRDLIIRMKEHFAMLRKGIETLREECEKDRNQSADAQKHLPSLQWIEAVPNPGVEALVAEWELMGLEEKLTHHLTEIEESVLEPSILEMEVENDDDFFI